MTTPRPRTGVLLMAHGTPNSLDELPEYLTRVRDGRPPTPELIEEMRANYRAIGGRSPLTDITMQQGRALQELLGSRFLVVVGMRNWHPLIHKAVEQLATASIRRIIGVPLAPQFSTLSVQKYTDAARAPLPPGMSLSCVRSFHRHPLLLAAFAERIRQARLQSNPVNEDTVFTAHSLPRRVVEAGDPYAEECAATAAGVAALVNLSDYQRAYQSAGRTSEPWLGPDLSDLIRERTTHGTRAFLVVPIGFVSDHTEILFDIDVQAARTAQACGATLRRTESLNTSPLFVEMLRELVMAYIP